jgi:hypothetical protein
MKLIAIHTVGLKGKSIAPGEEFSLKDDAEAARLINLGAAKAATVPAPEDVKDPPKS